MSSDRRDDHITHHPVAWLRTKIIPGKVSGTYYNGEPNGVFHHYWRWPITIHFRCNRLIGVHGVQQGWCDYPKENVRARAAGVREPAFMSIFWFGPLGVYVGAHRPLRGRRRLGPSTSWPSR